MEHAARSQLHLITNRQAAGCFGELSGDLQATNRPEPLGTCLIKVPRRKAFFQAKGIATHPACSAVLLESFSLLATGLRCCILLLERVQDAIPV